MSQNHSILSESLGIGVIVLSFGTNSYFPFKRVDLGYSNSSKGFSLKNCGHISVNFLTG
ncbi:hypothetical protein LEP1GSC016_2924 [Leptospira borgpetersenii serovar Hardjo-bovis str. Sponselee]|uniref:Uncharacterized protein n=1 Tax=Leptospira borgpetersenii serovar Hardjo-bovis str. Sponselee TaxID=1303729 RepID=M6C0J6_LEPBO|nr:hypothetical protein LEP1GSC016_2924 [Leptospira borgpetersenii serovar Hardjo-bovis str. Sponselee]